MARAQIMKDAGHGVRHIHGITGTIAAAVSAAGSAQNDATELTSDNSLITTASASQGVRLMSFNAGSVVVANGTAVAVLVYPVSGGKLNNGSANAPITLYPGLAVEAHAINALDCLVLYVAIPAGSVVTASLADGAVTTAKIGDDQVTYAKIQNISAQFRALGRNSASAGDTEEVTLTQLLDWIGTPTRGDILRRGASAWERLAVGGSGDVLTSDGTDPAWTAPATSGGIATIASGNLSGNAVTITDIPETYAYLVLHVAGGSMDTATRFPRVQVSVDNGSNYNTTAGNHQGEYWDVTGVVWAENAEASLVGSVGNLAAVNTFDFTVVIVPYHTGPFKRAEYRYEAPSGTIRRGRIWFTGSTANIDAVRIIMNNTGNFDAGTYALYGVS